jgi:flagellar basal-body rod modification protein FlgD
MNTNAVAQTPQASSGNSPTSGLPNSQSLNNMFLQLLVAQLQNQDPLNPLDPSQFVGQLAQFSELSEVTQIYQLLTQVVSGPSSSGTSSGGGTQASNGNAAVAIPQSASQVASPISGAVPQVALPATSAVINHIQGGL